MRFVLILQSLALAIPLAYVVYARCTASRAQRSARALAEAKKAFPDEDAQSLAAAIAKVSHAGLPLAPPSVLGRNRSFPSLPRRSRRRRHGQPTR